MTVGTEFSYRDLANELMAGKPVANILYYKYKIIFNENEFFIDTGRFITDLKEVKKHKDEFKIESFQWGQAENLQLDREAVNRIDKIFGKILFRIDLSEEPAMKSILAGLSGTFDLQKIQKTYLDRISLHPYRKSILEFANFKISAAFTLQDRLNLLFLLADLPRNEDDFFRFLAVYANAFASYNSQIPNLVRILLNIEPNPRIELLECTKDFRDYYTNADAYGCLLEILNDLPAYGWGYYAPILKNVVPQESQEFDEIIQVLTEPLSMDIIELLDDLKPCQTLYWGMHRAIILRVLLATPREGRNAGRVHRMLEEMNALTLPEQEAICDHFSTLDDHDKINYFENKKLEPKAQPDEPNYYEDALLLIPSEERNAEVSEALQEHLESIGVDKQAAFIEALKQTPEELRSGYVISLIPHEVTPEVLQPLCNKVSNSKEFKALIAYLNGSQENLPKLMEAIEPLLEQMTSHFLPFFEALLKVQRQRRKLLCKTVAQTECLSPFKDGNQLARILTSLDEIPKENRKALLKKCEPVMEIPKQANEKLELFCLLCLLPPRSEPRVFTSAYSLFKMVSNGSYQYIRELVKSIEPEQRDLAICQLAPQKDNIVHLEHLRLVLELYINIPIRLRVDEVVRFMPALTHPVDNSLQLIMLFATNEKCTVEELSSAIAFIVKSSSQE